MARPNDVFALSGELGTGKTVLARGVAIGLGIDAAEISSPTFIIMREHSGGRLPFFHIDLYRLEGVDLANTGWEECLDAGGVTVIEWPDRAGALLPDDRLDVTLEHIADTKRRIVVDRQRHESSSESLARLPDRAMLSARRAGADAARSTWPSRDTTAFVLPTKAHRP